MRGSMRVEDSRLASSMSSRRPVSFHQPLHDVRLDALAGVDEVLDRVGDLELAARADGSIARAASWMPGVNM